MSVSTKYLVKTPQVCLGFPNSIGIPASSFIIFIPNSPGGASIPTYSFIQHQIFRLFFSVFSYALQLRAASFLSGTISAAQEKPAHQNPKKNKLSTWRNLENPIIAKSCYQLGYISYRICYTVYHTGRRHFWTRQHTSATGGDRSHVSNIQNPCDTQLY